MDSIDSRSVALFSIHSHYATALLDGTKLVEFRKRKFPSSLDTIVIYATAPVSLVVGYVRISRIVEASPQVLWKRFGKVGGIAEEAFFKYFKDSFSGVALEVESYHPLHMPQTLSAIGVKKAPQSYQYLDRTSLEFLQSSPVRRAA